MRSRFGCLMYLVVLVAFWTAVILAVFSVLSFMGITSHAETVSYSAPGEEVIAVIISEDPQKDAIEIDSPPPSDDAAAEATGEPEGFKFLPECPLPREKQAKLFEMWTGAGYDYSSALALIDVETNGQFNEDAINHASHDYGLFQLNRRSWLSTFRKMFGISSMEDMLDFDLNVKGALYVYGDCVNRYGQTEKAYVAYNMGRAKYTSTKYSRKVLARQEKWRQLLEEVD